MSNRVLHTLMQTTANIEIKLFFYDKLAKLRGATCLKKDNWKWVAYYLGKNAKFGFYIIAIIAIVSQYFNAILLLLRYF